MNMLGLTQNIPIMQFLALLGASGLVFASLITARPYLSTPGSLRDFLKHALAGAFIYISLFMLMVLVVFVISADVSYLTEILFDAFIIGFTSFIASVRTAQIKMGIATGLGGVGVFVLFWLIPPIQLDVIALIDLLVFVALAISGAIIGIKIREKNT